MSLADLTVLSLGNSDERFLFYIFSKAQIWFILGELVSFGIQRVPDEVLLTETAVWPILFLINIIAARLFLFSHLLLT